MKKIICAIYLLFLFLNAFLHAETYDAKVEDLSNRKYFEKTLAALNSAKKSILVAMYIMTLSKESDSEVRQLLSALVSAKKRGVSVKVIMEYHSGLDLTPLGMRNSVYMYLLENGISVSFDDSVHRCAHLKTIVIDSEIVITGSANWSNLALRENDETNVLIYSGPLAEEITNEILSIPLSRPLSTEGSFDIQFLMPSGENKILCEIISSQDERALDIILFLLYNGKDTISFDLIAEKLGLSERMSRTRYRQQIIKVLKKIEKKYKFAEFDIMHGRDKIGIRRSETVNGQKILFPKVYFDSGWHKILSLSGKAVLIAFCAEFSGKETNIIDIPISYLAKKYSIKAFTFHTALQELKHYNIVKVYYSKGFKERKTTRIKFNGLYDMNLFQNKINELYKQYGKKNVEYARHMARIVFCAYDINVIKDILEQINYYGPAVVRRAFYIVARKNPDNPMRTYIYTIGIMRKLAIDTAKI